MKASFILSAFALLSFTAKAQVTINGYEFYNIGDTYQVLTADPFSITAGASGASQTWDFSGISSTGTSTINITANSTGSYPLANIVKTENGIQKFIKEDNTNSYILGMKGVTIDSTTYSENGIHFAKRPISYMSSYIDSSIVLTSSAHGHTFITVTADAYGTLILPSGTYTNVLRIKTVQNEVDSANSTNTFTGGQQSVSYAWYNTANQSWPLIRIDSVNNSASPTTSTIEYLANPLAINDVHAIQAISAANISNNQLQITGGLAANNDYTIELYNIAGQKIFTTTTTAKGNSITCLLNRQISNGIYIARITDINKQATNTLKVIKL